MVLSRRVALDGVWLDEIDPRILISGVRESPGTVNRTTVAMAGGMGSRVTGETRTAKRVSVMFQLQMKKGAMGERAALLEKITAWAVRGGWLTWNAKENRRIRVRCAQEIEAGDMREWTREYTAVFEADEKPWWEMVSPNMAVSDVAASGGVSVLVDGSLESPIEFELHNESGMAIQTVSVSAGGNSFSLSALGMQAGESLVADHDEKGVLRLRLGSSSGGWRSVLDRLSESSSDDLIAKPGYVRVTFTAQRACQLTAKSYGRFA